MQFQLPLQRTGGRWWVIEDRKRPITYFYPLRLALEFLTSPRYLKV